MPDPETSIDGGAAVAAAGPAGGKLEVVVSPSRQALGQAAASAIAQAIQGLQGERDQVRVLFASAASQRETLQALVPSPHIAWDRIVAFHLDEYVGLDAAHPASFRRFLLDTLFARVEGARFHAIEGQASSPEQELARYAGLLAASPPDLALLGIGENGHLAFNDPGVADFDDPLRIKVVRLDPVCRRQQVNDGAFDRIDAVPTHAYTLTMPEILRVPQLFVMVPGASKRQAVTAALLGPVSSDCPASALRGHPKATLYLDLDSVPAEE